MEVRVRTERGEQTLTAQLLIAADGMESRYMETQHSSNISVPHGLITTNARN